MILAPEPESTAAPTLDFHALLRKHSIRPNQKLGQHFLFEPSALRRVVEAAELTGSETVLEIGAGIGSLTLALAARAARVVSVEIDRRLVPALREAVGRCENVEVVEGDILAMELSRLVSSHPYLVVANIPYQITSLLIRRLLESPHPASRLVLTVQKEVADRIVAGKGAMSLLALSVRLYGDARLAAVIPAGAFYPSPEVDSAVLRIDRHAQPRLPQERVPLFFTLARSGFQQKRKKLRNAIASGLRVSPATAQAWLESAGISPSRRAQDLGIEDWERLVRVVEERCGTTTLLKKPQPRR